MALIQPLLERYARKENFGTLLLIAFFLSIFIVWMSLDAYQSHYVAGLRTLGDTTTKSIIGVPKEGRGDEWSTYLPLLKQAYHEGFPEYSSLKPYFEKLDWFIAIPHFNFSLIFLPNYALYWVLPGGLALSFQGFYYNAIFIISVVWLLVNLGVKRRYALACAFMLLCSQFYQVWWTSNFPALGASLLPFAVFTSRLGRPYRYLVLAWCMAHMLFGEMYPPFYISVALALVPFVFAARPDLLNWRDVSLAVLAAAVAFGCYLSLNWDFFQVVSHTSYPGSRVNTGGGSTVRSLIGLAFPTIATDAKGGELENLYTLAVGGTILPLLLISLMPKIKWDRRAIRLSLVVAVVAAVITWYMLIGVPREAALMTGLYMVPGPRMAIGISLLVALYCVTMISWNTDAFDPATLMIMCVGYLVLSYVVGTGDVLMKNFFAIKYYQWVFISVGVLGVFCYYFNRRVAHRGGIAITVILAGMACAHIVIYGSFNPIMHAKDILRPVRSQVINDWVALYRKNHDRSFGTIGNYGDLLRGEGLPALEAIHLANVSTKRYEAVFPSLSVADIHKLFNQFRGIAFANILTLNSSGPTVIFPVKPHGVSFANVVEDASGGGDGETLSSGRTTVASTEVRPDTFVVRWSTSLRGPLPIDDLLVLHLACRTVDSWVTRYPVVIPGQPVVPVALQGVAGQVTVSAPSGKAADACVSRLRITVARDASDNGLRSSSGSLSTPHTPAAHSVDGVGSVAAGA